jgi:predicted transcriptional regulator
MEDTSYVTIQGFMRTKLGLSGNDLIVYAIIYGFSQGNQGKFTGSAQYLADWCGSTKRGIYKNLNSLVERGLIIKDEVEKNGIKFCDYRVSQFTPSELSSVGSELSSPHNIDNNIDKKTNTTNVVLAKENSFSFDKHTNKENVIYILESDDKYSKMKSEFKQILIDWCEYKDQRKPKNKHHYAEMGLRKTIAQTVNYAMKYGMKLVIEQINKAIASSWDGMNLDMLDKENKNVRY